MYLEKLIALVEGGKSLKEVAEELGKSERTVGDLLRKNGYGKIGNRWVKKDESVPSGAVTPKPAVAVAEAKTEFTAFDYGQVDAPTEDFLRECAAEIDETLGQAATRIGGILKKAQDKLAGNNQHNGVFSKWYESIGMKRDKVYALIRRYDLVFGLSDEQKRKLVEELPSTLTEVITKPSADSTPAKAQAKASVMEGDVKTLKEYRELLAKLEAAEHRAEKAEEDYETIRSLPPKVETRTEYVETEANAEAIERLQRYADKFGDIEIYETGVLRMANVSDVSASMQMYNYETRQLLKKYAYLTQYVVSIGQLPRVVVEEFMEGIDAHTRFIQSLKQIVTQGRGRTEVIEMA